MAAVELSAQDYLRVRVTVARQLIEQHPGIISHELFEQQLALLLSQINLGLVAVNDLDKIPESETAVRDTKVPSAA